MKVIDRYLESWNETDPARRRALIDEVWAEHGRYTDPLADAEGRDAIDATIAAVQGQFPGLRFSAGPVDAHHHIARFTWTLGGDGTEPLVVGFDVAVLTDDGRIAAIHGFLDKVPA
ncbi:nuclear transport factor 2 family protein [Micromonospora sp. MS34]|uniref:nuclear transport factor 2 family protein n=1 Tax=Micromonospora sp. MS34 TaxID=3385971 RepID=UPI0039A20DC2